MIHLSFFVHMFVFWIFGLFFRPRYWKGTTKATGNKMCTMCTEASTKSSGESLSFVGCSNNTTYTNLWPTAGHGWYDSEESHISFINKIRLPSKLITSPHFQNVMVWHDLLHVLYRGILCFWVASAITLMAKEQFWSKDDSWQTNLQAAYASCDAWARSHGYSLALDAFSADNFNVKACEFLEISCKGADVKIICSWLV